MDRFNTRLCLEHYEKSIEEDDEDFLDEEQRIKLELCREKIEELLYSANIDAWLKDVK